MRSQNPSYIFLLKGFPQLYCKANQFNTHIVLRDTLPRLSTNTVDQRQLQVRKLCKNLEVAVNRPEFFRALASSFGMRVMIA
jgi:hypothetical protein